MAHNGAERDRTLPFWEAMLWLSSRLAAAVNVTDMGVLTGAQTTRRGSQGDKQRGQLGLERQASAVTRLDKEHRRGAVR